METFWYVLNCYLAINIDHTDVGLKSKIVLLVTVEAAENINFISVGHLVTFTSKSWKNSFIFKVIYL